MKISSLIRKINSNKKTKKNKFLKVFLRSKTKVLNRIPMIIIVIVIVIVAKKKNNPLSLNSIK